MAIEKRENVLQNLSISATPGVDDKGAIYYTALVATLQTATCYVDTETNNIIKTEANPAYQQPDSVVQEYLGEQMALLVVGPIEAEKAKAKAAQDALATAQAEHASAIEALNTAHASALAAKDNEKTAAVNAEKAIIAGRDTALAAKQQELTDANAAHATALAAKEAEKATLQTKLTKAEQDLAELGGEPLAQQRKAEREKAEIAAKLEAITKEAKAAAIDIDAVVAEAKK